MVSEYNTRNPGDAHLPGLKEETNAPVRKVAIKIRID